MEKNTNKKEPTIKLYEAIFVTIIVLFLIYLGISIFS